MSSQVEPPTFEPGLHVESVDAPLKRASHVAADLDAVLCATRPQADDHLAVLQALPALGADAIAELSRAARRLAAAQRVVDGTLERAAADVGERLASTGSGLAVHPAAVRNRADAVLQARTVVAEAEDALRAHEEELTAAAARAADRAAAEAPEPDREPTPPKKATRRGLFGWFRRGSDEQDSEAEGEVSSLLRQVAETTDEAFGARRASASRDDQLVLRRAQRDRALEDLRVAERAWRDLAGDDPVEDAESVVRRFDPQHQDALEIARDTAGVRATERLLEDARRDWDDAWTKAGFDQPGIDDPAQFDEVARSLGKAVVLVGDATARAADIALAAPAAVVVVLEAAS